MWSPRRFPILLLPVASLLLPLQATDLIEALRLAGASQFAAEIQSDPAAKAIYFSNQVQTVFAPVDASANSSTSRLRRRQSTAAALQQRLYQSTANTNTLGSMSSGSGLAIQSNDKSAAGKRRVFVSNPPSNNKCSNVQRRAFPWPDHHDHHFPTVTLTTTLYVTTTATELVTIVSTIHDTETLIVPTTVHDTEFVTVAITIHDSEFITLPTTVTIQDTTFVTVAKTVTNTESVTVPTTVATTVLDTETVSITVPTTVTSRVYDVTFVTESTTVYGTESVTEFATVRETDSVTRWTTVDNTKSITVPRTLLTTLVRTEPTTLLVTTTVHDSESATASTQIPVTVFTTVSTRVYTTVSTIVATRVSTTLLPAVTSSVLEISSGLGNLVSIIQGNIPYNGGLIHVVDNYFTLPEGLIDTASANGQTTFTRLVSSNGLTGTFNNTPDLTYFIPANSAFAMPDATRRYSSIRGLLLGHAIPNFVGYLPSLTNGSTYKSLGGTTFTVMHDGCDYYVNNAKIILSNVIVDNGVAHVVDQVIEPSSRPTATAAASPNSGSSLWGGSIEHVLMTCSVIMFIAMGFSI